MKTTLLIPVTIACALSACAGTSMSSGKRAAEPVDAFMAAIAAHCGKAYAGRIVANRPASSTPDPFEGKALVMHVRGCSDPALRLEIPFHVGDDHSRTWLLTRTGAGLRLKHDHRHADGSPDASTMYGGDTARAGSAVRQEFPVDAHSIAMFQREGRTVSTENTWAMEIHPRMFAYELARPRSALNPEGRLFRVEFDLPAPSPCATPWGW